MSSQGKAEQKCVVQQLSVLLAADRVEVMVVGPPSYSLCSARWTASSRRRLWLLFDSLGEGSPDVGLLGRLVAPALGEGGSCPRRWSPRP